MKRGLALDHQIPFSPEHKLRVVEEYVPGKQITLAHIIANPDQSLYESLAITPGSGPSAIGIVTITPGEAALIVGDMAVKVSGVRLLSVDRAGGAMMMAGTVSQVEAALRALMHYAEQQLRFTVCEITRT